MAPRPSRPARTQAKKSRRARGTNPLFWSETRQLWVGRVPVGRNANNRIVYAERTHASQQELLKLLADVKPLGDTATVGAWCDRWLAEADVRPNTRDMRRCAVEFHIRPTLGHLPLKQLTRYQIQQAVATWARSDLAHGTVRLYLGILHTALGAARAAGLRPDNPAAGVRAPQGEPTDVDPFTREEVARIIAEASRSPATRIFALMAVMGCRIGEALALDVEHYNPATHALSIKRTLNSKTRQLGPTKSRRGVRAPTVPAEGRPAVLAAIGERTAGPLFPSQRSPDRRSQYRLAWKSFHLLLRRLRIRERGTHQFRHSVATHLLARQVPIGDVAKFLGDTPEAIMRTYCHATGVDVAAVISQLYGPADPPAREKAPPSRPRARGGR